MTLHQYFFWYCLVWVLVVWLCLTALIACFDLIELLRRAANKENVTTITAMHMALFKIPSILPLLAPFAALFGGLIAFYRMEKSNEIISARAAGLQMHVIICGPLCAALAIGILMLAIIDPVASAMTNRYSILEEQNFGTSGRGLTVSTEGIWLRDRNATRKMIISGSALARHQQTGKPNLEILNGKLYTFDHDNRWSSRFEPEHLYLHNGDWIIEGGNVMRRDGKILPSRRLIIASSLTGADIENSDKKPETIPVYKLPKYIKVLNSAGINSLGHQTYFYYQASLGLMPVAMMFIAAYSALLHRTRGHHGKFIVLALIYGFLLFIIKDFMYILGTSGRLPPAVAGFAPLAIFSLFGLASIIRAENRI